MPVSNQAQQHGLLHVTSVPGTPPGSYGFTCSVFGAVPPLGSFPATYVVGAGPPVPPSPCVGAPPPTTAILGDLASVLYTFSGTGVARPVVMPIGVNGRAFQVTIAPGVAADPSQAFAGFGFDFGFPACVDARSFSGVEFTVSGDLGTCGLVFSAVTSEDTSLAYNPLGACTAEPCYPPMSAPLSIGTTVVRFKDLSGGMPMSAVDPSALVGVQWTLNLPTDAAIPPCVASFTISDVSFVP